MSVRGVGLDARGCSYPSLTLLHSPDRGIEPCKLASRFLSGVMMSSASPFLQGLWLRRRLVDQVLDPCAASEEAVRI